MTTYALLIYRTGTSPPTSPTSDGDGEDGRALAGHIALQAEARSDLHAVARLDAPRTARTVRARTGSHEVTDGPFIESKEWLVGFYLVDCEDEEQAAARARGICDRDHAIEVRPVGWRWRP